MRRGTGKARRREYRRALAVHGRIDRFTERMQALQGGSAPCDCCTLVRPGSDLEEGICGTCRSSLIRLRTLVPTTTSQPSVHLEPGIVWADASFDNGVAGIAVCGALGEHVQQVEASSSTHAEVLALRWAMEIARASRAQDLTFRTDCQSAYQNCRARKSERWVIEQVPRSRNLRADYLARRARLALPA
jgi:hypothetical protein